MMYLPIDKLVGSKTDGTTTVNINQDSQANTSNQTTSGVRNIFRTREAR